FLSELARHYLRHLEAIYPSRNGERLASVARWLALQIVHSPGAATNLTEALELGTVKREFQISGTRALFAKSFISRSDLRYATLFMESIWSTALCAQLFSKTDEESLSTAPATSREGLGRILFNYGSFGSLATSALPGDASFDFR